MNLFISQRKDYKQSFDDFVIEKIFNNSDRLIKIPFELNENSKLNVFYFEDIQITIKKQHEDIYEFKIEPLPLSKIKEINFGCELELCLDLFCTKQNKIKILESMSRFRTNLNSKTEDEKEAKWFEYLSFYIKDKIMPNLSEEFILRFPKACIALKPKSGSYDYMINFSTKEIIKEVGDIKYEYIIFTRDASLVCTDTTPILELDKSFRQTFHCEIISPILKDIKDFEIIFTNILDSKCLDINSSQSFHVNVSAIDENNNPIYFSSGYINKFLDYFIEFENKSYREETKYAMFLHKYMQAYILEKYRGMIHKKGKDFTYNNFIKGKEYFRSYIDLTEKYLSVHAKSDTLLEFRLFPSESNLNTLINYISDCLDLLKISYADFMLNYKESLYEFQKLNLKAEIDYSPIFSYNGELYIENDLFPDLKSIGNNFYYLDDAIYYFFDTRKLEIIDIINNTNKKSNREIITKRDDKIYIYDLKYIGNNKYSIEYNKIREII